MQLRKALDAAIKRLNDAQVPSPRLNAELLMMFTLGCDRSYLYGHPERDLSPQEIEQYNDVLTRRSTGMPAQYITGHQEFWGLDLIVSPAVLIPRPETEHLIEAVLELVRLRPALHGAYESLRIVDVGTGSGAIAIALLTQLAGAQINAVDISSVALEVARANAARHGLESRVEFRQGDLLDRFSPDSFDFVVSNPPYVGESEEDSVQLEVRKFEPRNAVFAGPKGTEVIERLIPQALDVLKPGGCLVFEISGTIVDQVRPLLKDWKSLEIKNDLQGIARVVVAQKP